MLEALVRHCRRALRRKRRSAPSAMHLKGWQTRREQSLQRTLKHCAQIRASMEKQPELPA